MAVGLGSDYWGNALCLDYTNNYLMDAEFLPFIIKIFPIIFAGLGVILAAYIYNYLTKYLNTLVKNNLFINLYTFLNKNGLLINYILKLFIKSIILKL